MRCNTCKSEVAIITPHEQFLFGASGLCPECRDRIYEESYRDQIELRCCRNCDLHDWAEEVIVCGKTHRAVSTTGYCDGFEVAR